jgi:hypothetical protein
MATSVAIFFGSSQQVNCAKVRTNQGNLLTKLMFNCKNNHYAAVSKDSCRDLAAAGKETARFWSGTVTISERTGGQEPLVARH